MTPGQPPAAYYPQSLPTDVRRVAQPTTPMPALPGGMNGAGGMNGNAAEGPPGNPDAVENIKTEKEDTPPTKYLLERSLAETRLGELLDNRGIKVYGWTQMSYNASTASGTNLPRTLDDRANEFLLNQNYLVAEKTLDTTKKEFQLGWAMNWILPGSDARYTIVRGLWDDQLRKNNGRPVLYPIDPYQFYAQAFLPGFGPDGTSVKVGRFATHCSYEVVQGVDTPFVSRSYMFQYNPFTHTGVWATTPLNDTWTASYGLATGSDTFIDPANRPTFIGQLKWAPPEGKTNVLLNAVVTDPKYDTAEAFPFYNYYGVVVTRKVNDKMTYVADAAYSHIYNAPLPNGRTGFADWYGAANYFIYAHTDKVTSTLRAEVFNDSTGFRTGFRGVYTEMTYGVAWKPVPGLILRPSVRYDYNGSGRPFEGDRYLWTGTMECIVRW